MSKWAIYKGAKKVATVEGDVLAVECNRYIDQQDIVIYEIYEEAIEPVFEYKFSVWKGVHRKMIKSVTYETRREMVAFFKAESWDRWERTERV